MIRYMQDADIQEVAKLEEACFSMPWSEHSLKESLQRSAYLFLVAEEAGEIVGYAGLLQVQEEGDITNIAVKESFRGQGIGRHLTEQLLECGKKRGIQDFTLEVRVSNAAAIHVYESLGFEAAGIRKRFYEKPVEDALIMWKRQVGQ